MPLFAIHRSLDPAMSPHERELLVARSVGFAEPRSVGRPIWHRSFAVQTPERFETWCIYEGRSAHEIEWWNAACRVPFDGIREVTQWRPPLYASPTDRPQLHFLRGALPGDQSPDQVVGALEAGPARASVTWLRSYWDVERREMYSAVLASDVAAAQAFAVAAGLPSEAVDLVDEILPRDFAPLYESVGFLPYEED